MLANGLPFLHRHFGLLVVLLGAGIIALAPMGIGNDGIVRYNALDTLLRHGKFHGTKYSLYGPVAATPLWVLGTAIGYPEETVWAFNRIAFLAMVVALWFVLRPVLPREERLRFTVFVLCGSMFPWHVMGFFAEVFHVVCVGTGLALLAVRRGRWAIVGGAVCVWGTANVPATAVGLALAAVVLCWHRRQLRYLLLPACAAAMILLENGVKHGNPLVGGYGQADETGYKTALPYSGLPGFSYPFFFGVLSILISFGKGLVFFAPGLFAKYPQETEDREADVRLLYRVWIAVVVGLVLVYARWWSWYGGAVWGPRFLLFASLPASLVLARWTARAEQHSTWANVLVLLAVVQSWWVGTNGLVFQGRGSDVYWRNNFEHEALTWYAPECSVLWQPFVTPHELAWHDYARLVAFVPVLAYLAWPVVRVLALRSMIAIRAMRGALGRGPRWRF